MKSRCSQFARSFTCALLAMIILVPPGGADDKKKDDRLTPQSRIDILRFVSSEFAYAVRKLPVSKDGFRTKVGEPLESVEKKLNDALANTIFFINPGGRVQITEIRFKDKEIEVDLNTGSKQKKGWREWIHDHVQAGVNGGSTPIPTVNKEDPQKPPQGPQEPGATLILDFGKHLPDITPVELKAILSVFLDFSERSAATHWLDTIDPIFKKAIEDHRVEVGMDKEMVDAAMGKPDRPKIYEKENIDGAMVDTETWLYGNPPKVILIIFVDDKVAKIQTCSPACVDGMPKN